MFLPDRTTVCQGIIFTLNKGMILLGVGIAQQATCMLKGTGRIPKQK